MPRFCGLNALFVAGADTATLSTCVLRYGIPELHLFGATIWVSALCAANFRAQAGGEAGAVAAECPPVAGNRDSPCGKGYL